MHIKIIAEKAFTKIFNSYLTELKLIAITLISMMIMLTVAN